MAFNLQIQRQTYSEVISLPLLAGSVNGLRDRSATFSSSFSLYFLDANESFLLKEPIKPRQLTNAKAKPRSEEPKILDLDT
jgi:hypothetical protein